jgi:membrane-bound metal-dependent hydrolase YbcI (DUF457 family)
MSFPPAHMLIGAGLADIGWSASPGLPRWRVWAVSAAAAVVPDLDLLVGWIAHRPHVHGTFSHSLSALLLCTLVAIGIAGGRWGLMVGVGYGSHLLVDLLDARGPTNVTLGWPFSREPSTAIEPVLPQVPVGSAQGAGSLVDSVLQQDAIHALILQTALAAVFFVGLLGVAWLVRRARERWAPPRAVSGVRADEPDLTRRSAG